ncbi:4Fe-4S single cluster domain-containing protein [Actinomycetospora soli]|uniref:4Fe-4S single cluster domain-containing protein n=1 Tax=Actinomycetospora soli TaxID=2893887 RepID=UPI001E542B81|nr:4Fe-4S single cluster domain-containing protein [Actinomycetospora soli]MCD2187854.1 radical SAM protein [Actinomycetospora soli]
MTSLRINRLHHPVTVLGHGVRAGLWVQGCGLGCHGCASRDTWDPLAGSVVEVDEILAWLDGLPEPLDGLTVTGGEPLEQPEALGELLSAVDHRRRDRPRPFDILLFTGRAAHTLDRPDTLRAIEACDAVVAGPYVEARNTGVPLRGSDNQRIVIRTALGRGRYADPPSGARLQVATTGERTYLIGIPRRGDLERLGARMAADGLTLQDATWRS